MNQCVWVRNILQLRRWQPNTGKVLRMALPHTHKLTAARRKKAQTTPQQVSSCDNDFIQLNLTLSTAPDFLISPLLTFK